MKLILTEQDVLEMKPGEAFSLLKSRGIDFDRRVVTSLQLKCCESRQWALRMLQEIGAVSEGIQRQAILKICEEPELLVHIGHLFKHFSNDVKRFFVNKCCENALSAYRILVRWQNNPEDEVPEEFVDKAVERCCQDPQFSFYLLQDKKDIKPEQRRKAELMVCEEPKWSCAMRYSIESISEDVKRKAELKACEEPIWAFYLRAYTFDLSEEIQRLAEFRACLNEKLAISLGPAVKEIPDRVSNLKSRTKRRYDEATVRRLSRLLPETEKIIELIRLGMDPSEAVRLFDIQTIHSQHDAKT